MDSFIKTIFEDKEKDELVHSQFIKFSKGEFPNRAMIRGKNTNNKYTISTTAEYAKELILTLAEKLGGQSTLVTGAVISALDLDGFDYKEKKMAMGVRKYMIEKEMTGDEIIDLCNKIEKAFFALSFSTSDTDLIIKPKSPKSAKGSSSSKNPDKKAKIDFIKIKTTDKELISTLLLDNEINSNFKKIEIKHDIQITDIIIPDGEIEDFAKIRELAKRKGKIIRKIDIDGNEEVKETDFEA